MTIPITKQGVAEKMLEILVQELGLKAGQDVPDRQLKEKYRAHNHDAADLRGGSTRVSKSGSNITKHARYFD